MEVDAYLKRIGFTGSKGADIDTLKDIHLLHPQAIPFENLNPLLSIPVKLDIASLDQKLIRDRRGGYCFEHNLLLKEILTTLGFQVTGLAARVMWNVPEGVTNARTHMLLLVRLDNEDYIVDVGFGGLTLTAPLLLKPFIEQKTPHESFRLMPLSSDYALQVFLKGEWKPVYKFSLEEQLLTDYEVSNYYLSTHPGSHFVTGLIAARTTAEARYVLRNNEFAVHAHGSTDRQVIADVTHLKDLLETTFLIRLPYHPDLDVRLSALVQNS